LAAEQGDAWAHGQLGFMYYFGWGVPQDYVQAYMWFNLAASREPSSEQQDIFKMRDSAAERMTPAQVAEAQRLAQEWRPTKQRAATPSPERILPDQAPSRLVAEAQRLLSRLGLNPGSNDGVSGPRTESAVRAYQKIKGLQPDGHITEQLVAMLRRDAAKAKSQAPKPAPPKEPSAASAGTGFFVTQEGHILTCAHVVSSCRQVRVRLADGKTLPAVVLATNDQDDLALLKVEAKPKYAAIFRSGSLLRQGEAIVLYGFPLTGLLATSGNATSGNVTALAGPVDEARLMQISAPVQPGNSGGPVLDQGGQVVGMVLSKLDVIKVARVIQDIPQNVNFALKSSVAMNFLESRGVSFSTATKGSPLAPADLAARARAISVLVECVK
jgi:S1-C subfamily serine protease